MNLPTTAHVAALPEVIGVGQQITIYAWLDRIFDGAAPSGAANSKRVQIPQLYSRHHRRQHTQTHSTKTESKIQLLTKHSTYTPSQAGNYTVNLLLPRHEICHWNMQALTTTQLPHSSTTHTYQVTQQQPSQSQRKLSLYAVDTYPLPTEYWTRPIYGENSIWYLISSNWLGAGCSRLRWLCKHLQHGW